MQQVLKEGPEVRKRNGAGLFLSDLPQVHLRSGLYCRRFFSYSCYDSPKVLISAGEARFTWDTPS
jgi:hypothetical protein